MMIFDGKIYIRNEKFKPEPFIVVDKDSLQEIKKGQVDFQPKEGQNQSLLWKGKDEMGRSLEYTPLMTDGHFVYVIAR
jgi:hypothetical protein